MSEMPAGTPASWVSTTHTITYGWCPGCKALHRMDNCPDDRPAEQEYCICCEAIRSEHIFRAWDLASEKRTTKRPES